MTESELETIDTSRDVEGYVHGIVSLDPPRVRCDGCGVEAVGTRGGLSVLILTCGIEFRPGLDGRRLCSECRAADPGMSERFARWLS